MTNTSPFHIYTQLRQIRESLTSPVPDLDALLHLLCLPLDLLNLLDDSLRQYGSSVRPPPEVKRTILLKWIPSLQTTILERIVVDWYDALKQEGNLEHTITQYFVPSPSSFLDASLVGMSAYDILLNAISRHGPKKEYRILPDVTIHFILNMLSRLSVQYTLDTLHQGIFDNGLDADSQDLLWNDCVKNLVVVPTKVANYIQGNSPAVPHSLLPSEYFEKLCLSAETIIYRLSKSTNSHQQMSCLIDSMSSLLEKLLRIGLFPSDYRTQPYSFFNTALGIIERRILVTPDTEGGTPSLSYSFLWQRLIASLTSMDSQQVIRSLLSCLDLPSALSRSTLSRQTIKRTAYLLCRIFGPLSQTSESGKERWHNVIGLTVLSTRSEWNGGVSRIIACWASGLANGSVPDINSMECLADAALTVWTDVAFIKYSNRIRHEYMTVMFLLAISYLPPKSDKLINLSLNPKFLQSMTAYMEHSDPFIRRLGLLVVEVLSAATRVEGKALTFGTEMWEGDDEGKEFCRELRALIVERDVDADLTSEAAGEPVAEVQQAPSVPFDVSLSLTNPTRQLEPDDSDDDSLMGYDSVEALVSAPSMEELDENEKDPTLNNGKTKKVPKPVYLADLGAFFQDSKDPDRLQLALSSAVELIRRKKNYGTELEENAVNLVHAAIALQDDQSLPNFEQNRQGMLNSLVACCPKKATVAIIEQFFNHQYSVVQRSAMLTALVHGARELAGLGAASEQVSFPAKHAQLILMAEDASLQRAIQGISDLIIDKQASIAESALPAIAREKKLRIRRTLNAATDINAPHLPSPVMAFKDLAAEFFIAPFVNRFWMYFRDEQTREQRSALSSSRYRGAATGMILSPLMLGQILAALGVLMDAARFSPSYLAILAPEVLELAVAIGAQVVNTTAPAQGSGKQPADVVLYAAHVALIILDASVELDAGRTLAMEHAELMLTLGDWAKMLFENEEKGVRLEGAGSVSGGKLERVSASLVLKVHNILDQWQRSIISAM
ncbi:hypothetical protein DACRYDRAFT_51119 [Dacryopinax primogenitus]|uniref:Telomere length regulation protein conserved domain-containing protein n=1 Tax=Dacryopinax primogenitus (strain DJM 731) TaxID=1858805 RepID=M5G1B6_DACPD|nr:uncharacterized protein DACRYDRAFT_51119 [Dacryopinax primogenitus]EJU02519.1 hypothetical protein DACRYDRAFT_51119 [Dacryopinax primogenitus]